MRALKPRHLWTALGVAMLAWGLRGLLTHVSHPQLLHTARLVLIDVVGHDGVFAPACVIVGVVTAKLMPGRVRTPVRVGLAFAGLFTLLALPSITSAHRLRNPSVLPLDYERNLGLLVGITALTVLLSALLRYAWGRTRRPSGPSAG